MKNIILPIIVLCCSSLLYSQTKDYPIPAASFAQVHLFGNYWLPPMTLIERTVLNKRVPAFQIENGNRINTAAQGFMAIPYGSGANKGQRKLIVWFPSELKFIDLLAR